LRRGDGPGRLYARLRSGRRMVNPDVSQGLRDEGDEMAAETDIRPLVVRGEGGLGLAGTRITLYDVMDYLTAGWPPHLMRNRLGLSEEQIQAAVEYIDTHRDEVEAEYEQVLREAAASRAYWEAANEGRTAASPTPRRDALRAKLSAWRERHAGS
jgi:uncharacterized protein (DUF433 family)